MTTIVTCLCFSLLPARAFANGDEYDRDSVHTAAASPVAPQQRCVSCNTDFLPYFVGHSLSCPVDSWTPLDIDGDGVWELAITGAGTPKTVGVYDPDKGGWIDGPRSLDSNWIGWTAAYAAGGNALEYTFLVGQSIYSRNASTNETVKLADVPTAGRKAVFWGSDSVGASLVAVWIGDVQFGFADWHVELYSVRTGQHYATLPVSVDAPYDALYDFAYDLPAGSHNTALVVHRQYNYQMTEGPDVNFYSDALYVYSSSWVRLATVRLRDVTVYLAGPFDPRGFRSMVYGSAPNLADGLFLVDYASFHGLDHPHTLCGLRLSSGATAWTRSGQQIARSYLRPALFDLDGTGEPLWCLPLYQAGAWERRSPLNGTVVDTLTEMPSVDLYAGALFEPSESNLFYFLDSSLYIWTHDGMKPPGWKDDAPDAVTAPKPAIRAAPNPFNAAVTVTWSAETDARSFDIYNVLGERVRSFDLSGLSQPGRIQWDGTDVRRRHLGSGIYFGVLSSSTSSAAVKLVLLK